MAGNPLHRLMRRNIGEPCCFVVRKRVYAIVGVYRPPAPCADWDMWLRIAASGSQFLPVHETRAAYRQHPGGMSANLVKMWETSQEALAANRNHHHHCRQCRASYRSGRLYVNYACVSGLIYHIGWRKLVSSERKVIAKIILTNPWTGVVFLAKHLGRSFKRQKN